MLVTPFSPSFLLHTIGHINTISSASQKTTQPSHHHHFSHGPPESPHTQANVCQFFCLLKTARWSSGRLLDDALLFDFALAVTWQDVTVRSTHTKFQGQKHFRHALGSSAGAAAGDVGVAAPASTKYQ